MSSEVLQDPGLDLEQTLPGCLRMCLLLWAALLSLQAGSLCMHIYLLPEPLFQRKKKKKVPRTNPVGPARTIYCLLNPFLRPWVLHRFIYFPLNFYFGKFQNYSELNSRMRICKHFT